VAEREVRDTARDGEQGDGDEAGADRALEREAQPARERGDDDEPATEPEEAGVEAGRDADRDEGRDRGTHRRGGVRRGCGGVRRRLDGSALRLRSVRDHRFRVGAAGKRRTGPAASADRHVGGDVEHGRGREHHDPPTADDAAQPRPHDRHGSAREADDDSRAHVREPASRVRDGAGHGGRQDDRKRRSDRDERREPQQQPDRRRGDESAADAEHAGQHACDESHADRERRLRHGWWPYGLGTTGKRPVMAVRSTLRSPLKSEPRATSSQTRSIMIGQRRWNA
jgi:hypothetical protein